MWETIIPVVITFIVGLVASKVYFKKALKAGKELVEFGYALMDALKPDEDGTRRITEEEYKTLKKEFVDIINVFKE